MSDIARTTLWLLALIAGIVATVVQLVTPDAHREASHDHGQVHAPTRLFDWDVPDVAALSLRHGDAQRRFEAISKGGRSASAPAPASADSPARAAAGAVPDGGGATSRATATVRWQEQAPAPGDRPFDPEAYLSLLSQARADRRLPAPEVTGDDRFGLTQPVLHVEIQGQQGAPLATIDVGGRTPDGYGRYVRLAGDHDVLIVPNYQFREALRAMGVSPDS